jgi:hypothetical protein
MNIDPWMLFLTIFARQRWPWTYSRGHLLFIERAIALLKRIIACSWSLPGIDSRAMDEFLMDVFLRVKAMAILDRGFVPEGDGHGHLRKRRNALEERLLVAFAADQVRSAAHSSTITRRWMGGAPVPGRSTSSSKGTASASTGVTPGPSPFSRLAVRSKCGRPGEGNPCSG